MTNDKTGFMGLVQSINGTRPSTQRTSLHPAYPAERLGGLTGPSNTGPPLAEGEVSVQVRLRAPAEVAAWWLSLTALERGVIVTAAHAELQAKEK